MAAVTVPQPSTHGMDDGLTSVDVPSPGVWDVEMVSRSLVT